MGQVKSCFFFRLLSHEDKGVALAEAVAAVREGRGVASVTYESGPASFSQIPGSPFAYWVSDSIRRLFKELPPFESEGRTVKQGLATADDFRFVRAWWEVPPEMIVTGTQMTVPTEFLRQTLEGKRWAPFAKGGAYSPYYADLHLVANWEWDGLEMKAWAETLPNTRHWSRRIPNSDSYFRPGLTWPLRGLFLSAQAVPAGAIFSIAGKLASSDNPTELRALMGVMNSTFFDYLVGVYAGTFFGVQYEAGLIGRVPLPKDLSMSPLGTHAMEACRSRAMCGSVDETNHLFYVPACLLVGGDNLRERFLQWLGRLEDAKQDVAEQQRIIEEVVSSAYRIGADEREEVQQSRNARESGGIQADLRKQSSEGDFDDRVHANDLTGYTADLLSYAVGCSLGRWNIRVTPLRPRGSEVPDPFAPLPACSSGMLTGPDGLPAREIPPGYPLRLDMDGILVDDEEHRTKDGGTADIVGCVRQALGILLPDRGEAIESEACGILGVRSLRDYFRTRFFDEHIKRYSKSRRKAPIYWYVATRSKAYGVWLYYHRLNRDTLFKLLKDYVEPKVALEERRLREIESQTREAERTGEGARTAAKRLEDQRGFLKELYEFLDNLAEVAHLKAEMDDGPKEVGYDPDLNDGVVINIAPFWKLTPWKEAEATWNALRAGKYDWAHLAYRLWPDRVREKCKTDRSLAITHGLEYEFFPAGGVEAGPRRTKRKAARPA
jgi:hypothetical protein